MPTTGSTSTGYAHFIILVIICSSSMLLTTPWRIIYGLCYTETDDVT